MIKKVKLQNLKEDNRMYHLLESVGTKPNVMYQTKVRNTNRSIKLIKKQLYKNYGVSLRSTY